MAIPYGFRKVKVFENVPAGTNIQVDELFGVGGYGYFTVQNVNVSDGLKLTINANPGSSNPGMSIPIPMDDAPYVIPMMITNFTATDVVTVVAYGN